MAELLTSLFIGIVASLIANYVYDLVTSNDNR